MQSNWNYSAATAAVSGRRFLCYVKMGNGFCKAKSFCYNYSNALR